jgi:hypothetical protein
MKSGMYMNHLVDATPELVDDASRYILSPPGAADEMASFIQDHGGSEKSGIFSGQDFTDNIIRGFPGVTDDAIMKQTAINASVREVSIRELKGSGILAAANKEAVCADIASRMGTTYDDQLLGESYDPNDAVYGIHGSNPPTPNAQLLTKDDVWRVDPHAGDAPTYQGKLSLTPDLAKYHIRDAPDDDDPDEPYTTTGTNPVVAVQLREDGVSNLVQQWAQTSNDGNATSLAMQESAAKEFGLTKTAGWVNNQGESKAGSHDPFAWATPLDEQVQNNLDKNGSMYQAFFRAQYDSTQAFFKANNIDAVPLFRGFDFAKAGSTMPDWANSENWGDKQDEYGEMNNRGTVDVPSRPMNAFATDENTAIDFANPENGAGVVISGLVPVSQILSTSVTGFGCTGETEMVVLGGTNKWNIRK